MCTPQPSPSNHKIAGISAAPVCTASAAVPPLLPAFSPNNSTSIPPPATSRERLRPVARVRWHGLPGQRAELPVRRLGAAHPAPVAPKYPAPGAPAAPGTGGGTPETPLGPGPGQPAPPRPAEAVSGIGQPVL